MRLPILMLIATAVSMLAASGTAHAQARGGQGQSGGTGGFTGGSMFGGGSTSGLGGTGGGLGGTGGGLGGAGGARGGAAGGAGGATAGAPSALGGQGAMSALGQQQNAGFIGRNGGNNQFIGANAAAANGQNGQQGGQNRQGRNSQRNSTQNQFNQNGGGQNTADRNAGVRPRQQVAFEYPKPKLAEILTNIDGRFKKLSKNMPSLNSVALITEDDGTVVLTGEARNRAEAKFAESLVRLEPGVRTVRNDMTFPAPVDDAQ